MEGASTFSYYKWLAGWKNFFYFISLYSTKLYGSYELGNNFPAFGTMHSIEAVRSMSSKFFNEFELEKADSTQGITLEKCLKSQRSVEIRSESSVFIKVTSSDPNMSEEEATVYLKNSCQECFPSVMIRKPREADMEVYSVVSKVRIH